MEGKGELRHVGVLSLKKRRSSSSKAAAKAGSK